MCVLLQVKSVREASFKTTTTKADKTAKIVKKEQKVRLLLQCKNNQQTLEQGERNIKMAPQINDQLFQIKIYEQIRTNLQVAPHLYPDCQLSEGHNLEYIHVVQTVLIPTSKGA